MKRTGVLALALAAVTAALMLGACGKSEFGVTENSAKSMLVSAENAEKDAFFMVGTLEVDEGEQIVVSADLTQGSIRTEIIAAPDESIEEMPETDGEAIMKADLIKTDGESGTVPAGNYMLKATCLEKATGTVRVEVQPASGNSVNP